MFVMLKFVQDILEVKKNQNAMNWCFIRSQNKSKVYAVYMLKMTSTCFIKCYVKSSCFNIFVLVVDISS